MTSTSPKFELQKTQEQLRKYKGLYESQKESLFDMECGNMQPPCSKDYDLFDFDENNRPLHWDKELERSMRTYGFWPSKPIGVKKGKNGRFVIKSGHNRFAMAKKLGIPIYFVVDETDVPIAYIEGDSNVHERWSPSDWISIYVQQGKKDYLILRETAQRYNIGDSLAVFLLAGGAVTARKIRSGNFKIADAKFAYMVLDVANKIEGFGVKFAKSTYFLKALSYVLRIEGLDWALLLHRIRQTPTSIQKRVDIAGYFEEIETIYNFRTAEDMRIPIKHLADKEARKKRQAVVNKVFMRKPDWEA